MPFTFAHPGFAIWLRNKWFKKLSLSGLIFGSITPDLDILLRFSESRYHLLQLNLLSILILVPLTFILIIVFHKFCRNTFIDNLPDSLNKRLIEYKAFNFISYSRTHLLYIIVSIVIGIVLHFLLDIIGHLDAWYFMTYTQIFFARFNIELSENTSNFFYYFWWFFPQLILTIGGFYLIYKSINIKCSTFELDVSKKIFWLFFLVTSFAFMLLKFIVFNYEGNGFGWHFVLIYGTAGIMFSLFVTPIMFRFTSRVNRFFK